MPPRRLENHPLTTLERGRPVTFYRNGKPVEGFADEPLAAALYATGQRVLGRSMRYHRARGYFCGVGQCTHCFVRLNGVPNARACEAPCEALAWLEDQNAIPNAEHDVLAAADLVFSRYLDAHHAFVRPAFLKPLYTRLIRAMAGFGRAPRTPVQQAFRRQLVQPDVCVIGGGPAGLAAAEAAARNGLHVLLLDRNTQPGGRLAHLPTPFLATAPDAPNTEGKAFAREALTRAQHAGVRHLARTRAFGIYDGLRIAADTPTSLVEVQARGVILAPGGMDAYTPFPGSDRAGVLLVGGAQRLLNQYGVLPGAEVAIVGAHRDGLLLARDLLACGARVAALVDPRPEPPSSSLVDHVRRLGVPIRWNTHAATVEGRRAPRALRLEGSDPERVPCDAVVLAGGRWPAVELAQQAGCRLLHDPRRGGFLPATDEDQLTSAPNVWAAGSAAGVTDEWGSHLSGRVAGLAAAQHLNAPRFGARELHDAREAWTRHQTRLGVRPVEVPA